MPKILLIIIAATVLGFFYFNKNQSPPQETWKTYANEDFGVSFSYPANLYIPTLSSTFPSPIDPQVFTDDLKTVPVIYLESIKPKGPDGNGPLSIEKFVDTTMEDWLAKNSEAEKSGNGSLFPVSNQVITKTTFAKYPALLLIQKTNPQVPTSLYLVQVGENVFYISYLANFPVPDNPAYAEYNAKFDKEEKPTIQKILSSIKFL